MSCIKVKSDAVNHGLEYESKLITALAAKLVKDRSVKDFWIVQNTEEIDKFDDIILRVTYNDERAKKIFLIQAKHKDNNKPLPMPLRKYEECYKKVKEIRQNSNTPLERELNSVDFADYYFCIFTNATINNSTWKKNSGDKTITLIDIKDNYRYKNLRDAGKLNADFHNKLYMFSEQPNHENIVSKIIENVDGFTEPMIYNLWNKIAAHLVHFDGKGYVGTPLTKDVFAAKCMEVVLCHQISTYMTSTKEIDKKYIEIWNSVFSKRFVLINKKELENLLPLIASYYETKIHTFLKNKREEVEYFNWNNCFHDMFRLDNSVRNILGEDGRNMANLIDLLIYMWNQGDFPLIINSIFVKNFQWFIGNNKRHFIVIIGDDTSHDVIENIRSVSDFAETVHSFCVNDKVMNIKVSLQGRERVSLKEITSGNEDVLKSISVSDVLLWTAKNEMNRQIGGTLKTVGNDYISRLFHPEEESNKKTEENVVYDSKNTFTIISNEAGMGKSTVLCSLARKYNNKHYVIFCNLSDCTKDFGKMANPHSDPVQYFYEKMESKKTKITDAIYKHHKKSGKIVLFLDSYDEILPKHEDNVLRIIEKILEKNITLYITMRVQAETKLMAKFKKVRLLRLTEFTNKNIRDYLKKVNVTELKDMPYDFLRIPFNLKMYADHYKETEYMELNKTHLYQHFVSRKIEEFYKNRKIEDTNVQALISDFKESTIKHHYRLALVLLFGLDVLEELEIFKEGDWQKTVQAFEEYKLSLGIVTNVNPVRFLHKTFAEYLAAEHLAIYPNKQLYLRILTDKNLSVVYEFLYNIRSNMAGELPGMILNGNLQRVKDILFASRDAAAKEQKSMYPIQWAAISCYMNRGNSRKTTSLEILNYLIQTIKQAKFVYYEIENRDKILNWTWLNYLTGYEDDTYLHYRELIRYTFDENTPTLLRKDIDKRITMGFQDENGCNLFDLVCRDKETIANFEGYQKRLEDLGHNIDDLGRNVLHHACYGGKYQFVQNLLKNTNLISEKDHGGLNAFHHACSGGNYEIVHYFLANFNEPFLKDIDNEGKNAFHHACSGGNLQIVKELQRMEINEDKNGLNGLHYACKMGFLEIAEYLLSKLNFDVNQKTNDDKTAMHYACMSNNVNLVEFLLSAGAELNARDERGLTPFHYACSNGKRDLVQKLLQTNLDVIEDVDDKGMNPLHHACRGRNADVAKLLLNAGLKPTGRDKEGLSIIHHACAGGNVQLVKYILNSTAGRDAVIADSRRRSGLHNACAGGHREVAKLLIANDFDPKLPDENRETPLHYAAQNGHVEVIDVLLQKHVDPNAVNKQLVTPLQMACANGHEEAVQLMLYANGDPTYRDARGWNSLHHAFRGDNLGVIKMLLNQEMDPFEKSEQGSSPIEVGTVETDRIVRKFLRESTEGRNI